MASDSGFVCEDWKPPQVRLQALQKLEEQFGKQRHIASVSLPIIYTSTGMKTDYAPHSLEEAFHPWRLWKLAVSEAHEYLLDAAVWGWSEIASLITEHGKDDTA